MQGKNITIAGFTLMELLLYVGIASVMLFISSLLLSTLLKSRVKNQTISEVEQQGLQVMQMITRTMRNSETLNAPLLGETGGSLSLNTPDTAEDPTLFYISDDAIVIQEGSGNAIALTNSRVIASDLSFKNLSHTDTPGSVRISFTLTHKNPLNWNEYDFDKTFFAGASLR